jgi:hypothetical protein
LLYSVGKYQKFHQSYLGTSLNQTAEYENMEPKALRPI